MVSSKDDFKNETSVKRVGGRLSYEYYLFKDEIENINKNFFELFQELNLTDDIGSIIETLNAGLQNLCEVFVKKAFGDIESGKIPPDKFLSESAKKGLENKLPGDITNWKKVTRRGLISLYSNTVTQYKKKHGIFWLEARNIQQMKPPLDFLREALFVTQEHIEIDGKKFVEVYMDYLAADESETKKIHEQAAEAINRFFNGAFPITQKELSKYFVLESGTVKVNPKSVNLKDYARLGARTIRKAKKDGGKKK